MISDHYRFEQIAPHAWAAVAVDSGAGVGNAGIADLGGRALVVDCGFTPGAARDLRAAAEELAAPAERLFITHADFDHYGGAQAFADVPILAAETTAATIAEAGPGRVAGMQEEMETYLAELEEQDAPQWEREQSPSSQAWSSRSRRRRSPVSASSGALRRSSAVPPTRRAIRSCGCPATACSSPGTSSASART